jgi:iron complex transport system permease protein
MEARKRQRAGILAFSCLAALVLVSTPLVGMQRVPLKAILDFGSGGTESAVFWTLRTPRVCLAFLAGAALAVSGMAFQALFRNPLATPFTLGVSSGAALGVGLYVRTGLSVRLPGIPGPTLFALLGALLAMFLVYGLTRLRRDFSTMTLLLAGVAVSFCFSSFLLFLQYLSDFTQSFRILRRLMGGLEVVGFDAALNLLPAVAAGTLILFWLAQDLNLLLAGEEVAVSRGVDVPRTRKILFFACSLMVGAVVAACGPIGFVGMMAPHICRLLIGSNHRILLPATFLFGGAFLTLCDTLARTLIAPAEIPVGILTALLGGPCILWHLVGRKGRSL